MVQSINKINRIQGIRFLASALQKWSKCLLAKRYSERMTEFDRNCHLSAVNKIQPRLLPFSKIEIGAIFYLETEGNDIDATQQYIRHMISTEIKQTIQLYKKKLLASHYVFSHKDMKLRSRLTGKQLNFRASHGFQSPITTFLSKGDRGPGIKYCPLLYYFRNICGGSVLSEPKMTWGWQETYLLRNVFGEDLMVGKPLLS